MRAFESRTLVVIGAGPKGIAVAVKAKVLEELGVPVDRVVLIEKNGVAANWSGCFGYTNGEMKLGTSPEKDVVFPLETDLGDKALNERLRQRLLQFTWMSFLVQTKRYTDWVDRGRPAPCHQLWALYLQWVAEQLAPQVEIIRAEVLKIDISQDLAKWDLLLKNPGVNGPQASWRLRADRLMLTGPGKTRMDFVSQPHSAHSKMPTGTYDLESFWAALKSRTFSPIGRVAIIGAGENAASALLALSEYAPSLQVDVISPKGFISTRAEGFYENQVYSQPERNRWSELELADRVDFIERTDLGVFSAHAMSILKERIRHPIIAGRVTRLEEDHGSLKLSIEYGKQSIVRRYDTVVLATGFDQVAALRSILTEKAFRFIEEAIGSPLDSWTLAQNIQADLSVAGVQPVLHLPMLAGVMQGPGFANLSCLGRLSDRVVVQTTAHANVRLLRAGAP